MKDLKNIILNKDGDQVVFHDIDKDIKINIIIEKGIKSRLIEVFNYNCHNTDGIKVEYSLSLEEESSLELVSIEYGDVENVSVTAHTKLFNDSYLDSMRISAFNGSINTLSDTYLEKKAKCNNYCVFINSSNIKQEFNLNVYHEQEKSESNMKNFAICKNDSLININTNGLVLRGSKQAIISQKTKGILLSKESGISANPLLQIDEFDCLASHGAGIGAIDEEDLFYLMSRGLTRNESEKLIINGFINPLIERIENIDSNQKNKDSKVVDLLKEIVQKNL